MTKKIVTLLLLLLAAVSYASDIECVGTATQVVNGKDTLFIFKEEIHLRSTIGEVDWYRTDGTLEASATDEIYPDEGGYYIVSEGSTSAPCYVYKYYEPTDLSLTIVPDCNATTLMLTGDAKPFVYTRPDATTGTYARACTIEYNALAWNGEQWGDSAAQMTATLRTGNYILPALYAGTTIHLCYDQEIRSKFGLDSACVEATLFVEDVMAVNFQLTSLVTSRGTETENEPNRPTSQDLIQGSEYSGPLEVAFYSNPTPEVKYYRWAIYQDGNLIVTRSDQDIRYTFSDPGNYRVICSVNNQYCQADSMEVMVIISKSYLAVPNVFTPNGDGSNDEFRVTYCSLREFHCWVYNRWGHLVFEWTDPAKGWDGTIGGRPAAEGAYFYVIRVSLLLTAVNYLLEIPNRMMRRPKYQHSDQPVHDRHTDDDGFTPYEEIKDE